MLLGTTEDGTVQEFSFMTGMEFTCPHCGEGRASIPEGLWRGLGEAVKASDLTADQLERFGRYLADAPTTITPEELADRFPDVAPVINFTVNNYGSDAWLTVLSLLVSVLIAVGVGYWAHTDAEKATGAARPTPEKPLHLTNEDIAKIATQVERDLRKQQARERREQKRRSDRRSP